MGIYTISDLHLPLSVDKPMDVFGRRWENYIEKLEANWNGSVNETDTVIIGGDISWATYLNECFLDFEFINKLSGRKIFLKGNHDYWWDSITKLRNFCLESGFDTIDFLHNTSHIIDGVGICGTRGWIDESYDNFSKDDEKIFAREIIRLELSIKDMERKSPVRRVAVLHYPPVTKDKKVSERYKELFEKYKIDVCIYGHLHSGGAHGALEGLDSGITYKLVSADYMNFMPYKISFE